MKFFFEFIPLIAFFVAIVNYDIYVATAVLMVLMPVQIALMWYFKKPIEKTHWITLAVVLAFGAATLLFKDPIFIKWKPTIVNWGFAIAFWASQWITHKPLIQHMLDKQLTLPEPVWTKLNLSWIVFFFFLGGLNLYVAYEFDTMVWAQFKVFGTLALTFIFVIAQGVYLSKYIKEQTNGDEHNGN